MKKLLYIALLAAFVSATAAPVVEVKSPTEVLVDGVNFGPVVDTIANNRSLASDIQRALETWAARQSADHLAAQAKAAADHRAELAKVSDASAQIEKIKAAGDDAAKLATAVAEVKQTAKARRLAEIDAQLAELQAKRAALDAAAAAKAP